MLLSGARRTRLAILGGSLLLLCYAWVLFGHVATAVGPPESFGPFAAARMIASRTAIAKLPLFGKLGLSPADSWLLVPPGLIPGERPGTAVPLQSPGFALHVASVALLLGWTAAPYFISPIAALLCLELVYVIARELKLSRLTSVAATVIVAMCLLFVMRAVEPERGAVATFWCLAAIAAALVTRRGSPAWAFAAGFALGVAVLVRPAALLVVPALLVALRWKRSTIALFVLGALPPLAVLGFYDRAVYGGWMHTGHRIAGLPSAFHRDSFGAQLATAGKRLAGAMTPLLLVGAVAVNADGKISPRDRLLLLLWWAAFLLFPTTSEPSGTGPSLGYLLPGIPAMVLGSLMAWRDFVAHPLTRANRPAIAAALAAAALGIVLAVEANGIASAEILVDGPRQNVYPTAAHWAQRYVPDEGLILSREFSGALFFYSDRVPVRWDQLDPARFERVRARARSLGYRFYALLARDEVEPARRAAPGRWRVLSRVAGWDVTLWAIED